MRKLWGNDAYWAEADRLKLGGLTWSEVHGRLSSVEELRRFSLEVAPSVDTLRKRVAAWRAQSAAGPQPGVQAESTVGPGGTVPVASPPAAEAVHSGSALGREQFRAQLGKRHLEGILSVGATLRTGFQVPLLDVLVESCGAAAHRNQRLTDAVRPLPGRDHDAFPWLRGHLGVENTLWEELEEFERLGAQLRADTWRLYEAVTGLTEQRTGRKVTSGRDASERGPNPWFATTALYAAIRSREGTPFAVDGQTYQETEGVGRSLVLGYLSWRIGVGTREEVVVWREQHRALVVELEQLPELAGLEALVERLRAGQRNLQRELQPDRLGKALLGGSCRGCP